MTRKTIQELNEEEIRKVIADHFIVDTCKVTLKVGHKVFGVGPMERETLREMRSGDAGKR